MVLQKKQNVTRNLTTTQENIKSKSTRLTFGMVNPKSALWGGSLASQSLGCANPGMQLKMICGRIALATKTRIRAMQGNVEMPLCNDHHYK